MGLRFRSPIVCILALALASCAGSRSSELGEAGDEFIRIGAGGKVSCDEASALKEYEHAADLRSKDGADIWASCTRIYRCSRSALENLKRFETSSLKDFRIHFFDWNQDRMRRAGAPIDGLYVLGTSTILLSDRPRMMGQVCSDLYHELIHRFDPLAASSAKNRLQLEYNAYYFQQLLEAELMMGSGPLGQGLRTAIHAKSSEIWDRLMTREEMLRQISEVYGLPLDLRVADSLPAYPWEKTLVAAAFSAKD